MVDKKNILDKFSKIEEKLLVTKILDKVIQTQKSWKTTYSHFLDPYQQNVIDMALHNVKDIEYIFEGGYEGAERKIILVSPEGIVDNECDPLSLLNIELKAEKTLTHRDYLGSLMGLGIKREKIGDIIVDERWCNIIVLNDVAEYILYNLNKIGNTRINITIDELDNLKLSESKTKEIKCTVPSLRVDCIVSNGFGISRSKVAPFFSSGKVYVNWKLQESLSAQVKEGDTISVRGKGRVIIAQVGGVTKKGRTSIILKKHK